MECANSCKAKGEPTLDSGEGANFAMIEADKVRTSVKAQVAKEAPQQQGQSKFAQASHGIGSYQFKVQNFYRTCVEYS